MALVSGHRPTCSIVHVLTLNKMMKSLIWKLGLQYVPDYMRIGYQIRFSDEPCMILPKY